DSKGAAFGIARDDRPGHWGVTSAADGVALHAARVGGGLEHGAFRRALGGGGAEAALRPVLADLHLMAARAQRVGRRRREATLDRDDARLCLARPERARHVFGVEAGQSIASCKF